MCCNGTSRLTDSYRGQPSAASACQYQHHKGRELDRVEQKAEGRPIVSEGLAEHNQRLATQESSEKTAIVNLLHGIVAPGEGCNTLLMS